MVTVPGRCVGPYGLYRHFLVNHSFIQGVSLFFFLCEAELIERLVEHLGRSSKPVSIGRLVRCYHYVTGFNFPYSTISFGRVVVYLSTIKHLEVYDHCFVRIVDSWADSLRGWAPVFHLEDIE